MISQTTKVWLKNEVCLGKSRKCNDLTNDKIVDQSKLKVFADDNLSMAQK